MSAPMPSVPSATGFGRSGRAGRSRPRCSCSTGGCARRCPATVAVEVDAVGEEPVVVGEAASRPAAPASTRSSATWMCTPTPRSAARPAAASSVASVQREGGVDADQPRPPARRNRSFSARPGLGAVGPVAVGDPVGAHDPHADLGARVGDHVEAALDGVGGLVVVDDRGACRTPAPPAAPSMADHRDASRGRGRASSRHQTCSRISRKSVGVRRRRRHAPGQRRVEVVVGADEARGRRAHPTGVVGASAAPSATRRRGRAGPRPPRPRSAPGRSRPRP